MGDGGFIAQFRGEADDVVAVTNADWRCLVVHQAPVGGEECARQSNPVAGSGACGFVEVAEPANWKSISFDDSAWPDAVEYAVRESGPKDGYDHISWTPDAHLIWGPDLETNNTLLCRLRVD